MREDGLVDFLDCDDKASLDDNLEMNEHGVILVPNDARTQQQIFDLNSELREIKCDGREMTSLSPSIHGTSTASLPPAAAGGKLKTGEQISIEKHFKVCGILTTIGWL